jgi:hypothetical protein
MHDPWIGMYTRKSITLHFYFSYWKDRQLLQRGIGCCLLAVKQASPMQVVPRREGYVHDLGY